MMTIRKRLAFLSSFGWQDLFARHARRSSLVILLTVSLLTALTLLVYGLALGQEQVRLQRLRRDPLALCLWIEPGDGPLGNKITPAQLAALTTALPRHLRAGALEGCWPCHETSLDWFLDTSDGSTRSTSLPGRTIAPGDRLLRNWPLQSGRPFSRPEEAGVIVTEAMLQMLGKTSSPPPSLRLRSASGAVVEVPVIGVARVPFPQGHLYVLTEAYYLELLSDDPTLALPRVWTGPLPARLVAQPELPPAVTQTLSSLRLLASAEVRDGRTVWQLVSLDGQPPLRAWRQYVARLRQNLQKAGFATDPAFEHVVPLPADRPPAPKPQGYDLVGVQVKDLPDLKPAAAAAKEAGLQPREDVIGQIEGIGRSARIAVLVLTWVVVLVGGMAYWNVKVVQELRALQKVTEIGMLKAIGMDDRLLRQVYLAEATILWLLGSLLGCVVGLGGGLMASWALAEAPEERFSAFSCPWYLLLAVVLLGGVACWRSALTATAAARKASPIETLSAP